MKPHALDLFCGAGGATRGLQLAGFHVTGIDIKPQPNYCGDAFVRGDSLNPPIDPSSFAFIWASPPCQAYTPAAATARRIYGKVYPDLIEQTRALLIASGVPWVIENVMSAPLRRETAIVLCGLSFGLGVLRHRRFESNQLLLMPAHPVHPRGLALRRDIVTVAGGFGGSTNNGKRSSSFYRRATRNEAERAMGIDWHMTERELMQAIPPAYSQFIGTQAIRLIP